MSDAVCGTADVKLFAPRLAKHDTFTLSARVPLPTKVAKIDSLFTWANPLAA